LSVPEGCKAIDLNSNSTFGELRCEDSFLKWFETHQTEEEWRETNDRFVASANLGRPTTGVVPCEIKNGPGQCLRMSFKQGADRVLYYSGLTDEPRRLSVMCGFNAPEAATPDEFLPPVCRGIIVLK
jgi:hypothetical protein